MSDELILRLKDIANRKEVPGYIRNTARDAVYALGELEDGLRQAVQLAEVASDWDLVDVEIDGWMIDIDTLKGSWRKALGEKEE